MTTRRKFIVGATATGLAVATGSTIASPALAASWEHLGTRNVNLLLDHDRIHVGLLDGLYSHIRLEVSGNGIFINDLDVRFVSGQNYDVSIRHFIPAGGRSRDINLPGILRFIRHVDLTYRRVPSGGTAKVQVFGLRA